MSNFSPASIRKDKNREKVSTRGELMAKPTLPGPRHLSTLSHAVLASRMPAMVHNEEKTNEEASGKHISTEKTDPKIFDMYSLSLKLKQ